MPVSPSPTPEPYPEPPTARLVNYRWPAGRGAISTVIGVPLACSIRTLKLPQGVLRSHPRVQRSGRTGAELDGAVRDPAMCLPHAGPRMGDGRQGSVRRVPTSARRECLDWMLIRNGRHIEAVLREYWAHYNDERPHRSRNLRPPASRGDPTLAASGRIERTIRLGGLLSEYHQAPVAA